MHTLGEEINIKKYQNKPKIQNLLTHLTNQLQHALKFLIDLYMVLSRSTLSLDSVGFNGLINKKYEISYNEKENKNIPGVK